MLEIKKVSCSIVDSNISILKNFSLKYKFDY